MKVPARVLTLVAILALLARVGLSTITAADAATPPLITIVSVKETAGRSYLSLKKEVKIADMKDFAVEGITDLVQKATELKLGQGGPIMFTYYNFAGDPEQKFTAEIGL